MSEKKIVVVDTETTGLDREKDEVLSVTMIDGEGNVLLDTLVHPLFRKRWPKAQEINGIKPSDVKDAPYLTSLRDQIGGAFDAADFVIGYNLQFDLDFLGVTVPKEKQFDVMREFAKFYGTPRGDGTLKWSSLVICAAHYDYQFVPHSALEDCRATLHCYRRMVEDPQYVKACRTEAAIAERKRAEKEKEARRNDPVHKLLVYSFWLLVLAVVLVLELRACAGVLS